MQVREIMTQDVDIAAPDTPVAEIARRMRDEDIGVVPVGDADHIRGMLTDRDIVIRAVAAGKDLESTSVEQIMSGEAKCCFDDDSIEHAEEIMAENQVHRLPVVDHENHLVGILSLGDLCVRGSQECAGEALKAISQPS